MALQLERSRVREMYQNSPDRIACLGEDRSVLYTNLDDPQTKPAETPNDDPCYRVLYARDEACVDCAFDRVAAGAVVKMTQSETSEDGTVHWYSKMLYPVRREDGSTDSVVEIARDVTELHAAEASPPSIWRRKSPSARWN